MQDVAELMGPDFVIEVTELDARLALFGDSDHPYEAHGDRIGGWFEACAQVPSCRGVTLWGTSDATDWYESQFIFTWMRPNDPFLFDEEGYRKPAYYKALDAVAVLPNQAKGPQLPGFDGVSHAANNIFRCPATQASRSAAPSSALFLVGGLVSISSVCIATRRLRPDLWQRLASRCACSSGKKQREANEGLTTTQENAAAMEQQAT